MLIRNKAIVNQKKLEYKAMMSYHKDKQRSQRLESILKLCRMVHNEAIDPLSPRYLAEDCKYDLVMLRYEIDKMLRNSPDFGEVEKSWEKEITMMILKEN